MNTNITQQRTLCPRCNYVQKNCLCEAITTQNCHSQVFILQHPSETKHSKNSAKLVNLCIKQCTVIVGEHPEDFAQVKSLPQPVYLIYPSERAQPIERLVSEQTKLISDTQKPISLIFIDASWRKAYKMWQQNPWLQQLPNLTFNHAPKTRYQIRKHKRASSLSTLEAVAYSLSQLENADTSALFTAFDAMIAMHNRYRPASKPE